MKRLALAAAVLAGVAACKKADAPKPDTTTPAMAPMPPMDSAAMKAMSDSALRADSIRKADSVAAAMKGMKKGGG